MFLKISTMLTFQLYLTLFKNCDKVYNIKYFKYTKRFLKIKILNIVENI